MSYHTTVTGMINIDPPLKWNEFRDSPFRGSIAGDPRYPSRDVQLLVTAEDIETEDGWVRHYTSDVLAPAYEDSYSVRHLVEHVQEAIDSFPGHTFNGMLKCEGEETLDAWRVVVRNGRAVRINPVITWPDMEEAE